MKRLALTLAIAPLLLARVPARAQDAASAAPPAGCSIELVAVEPAGPYEATLRANVKLRYALPEGVSARIWAMPFYQGRFAKNGGHSGSGAVTGTGEVERFIVLQEPGLVDEIKISVADADDKRKQLAAFSFPVKLEWIPLTPETRAALAEKHKPGAWVKTPAAKMLGRPFPALAFTGLKGEAVDVAALKGKVVLVDFWATWCGPCRREMPNLAAAYAKYHDRGFEIVAISLDQDQAKLEQYLAENPMPWPQYFDGKGWKNEFAQRFEIHGIPSSFLLDRDGIVRHANLRGPELDTALAELLK